jgi:hypothetical protein
VYLRLFFTVVAALLGMSSACSKPIPTPPTGPAVREPGVEVPYPPPPGRVEVIPPAKRTDEVWVNGQWDWDGETWSWIEGSWRVPPQGSHFTPWSAVRKNDGRLMFRSAAWRTADGQRIADPFGEAKCPPLDAAEAP